MRNLYFRELCEFYQRLEETTKRLEMTDILVELLKKSSTPEIDKIIYLTQGKLHPDWYGLPEIGMAEKTVLETIRQATGIKIEKLNETLNKTGDIGLTAEYALKNKVQRTIFEKHEPLLVEYVYNQLDKITQTTGQGSIELKKRLLAGLLNRISPLEAKYISRIITGNLRLGIADMTILDALAIAFSETKENRGIIERAYNICSDLGYIAKTLIVKGLKYLENIKIRVGTPVRMMQAQRAATIDEILERLGKCAVEYKYDGERFQIHKNNEDIIIYSRRLEKITEQYPDAVGIIRDNVKSDLCILEAEAVAVNPETGEMLPFQELMHRRRKYDVDETAERYPIKLFFFDCLLNQGKDLTNEPYPERRKILEEIIKVSDKTSLSNQIITDKKEVFEKFFYEAVSVGGEGVMAKSIKPESIYQAGSRGWLWIKYKRDYKTEISDTLDLVVVGAFSGRGRRGGNYGSLLMACYDPDNDTFKTVARVASGFSDEDILKFTEKLKKIKLNHKHPRVETEVKAEIWVDPEIVLEIRGAELTLSPIHSCGFNKIKPGVGIAIRFPRFTGKIRNDKKPEDATTEEEIIELYNIQTKKVK
ncbi:MAG: ATP-dependent DNA ligase [Candidatus Odinarchaeia archaeon]